MTEFRRRLRSEQARWREVHGHPIGSQPIVPREGTRSRPVGRRLPLASARETGANFVTAGALTAAQARTSVVEAHQSFDHQRLWADLLWSPAMAFNRFGEPTADLTLADRAVRDETLPAFLEPDGASARSPVQRLALDQSAALL
jgi:hypothetical protein